MITYIITRQISGQTLMDIYNDEVLVISNFVTSETAADALQMAAEEFVVHQQEKTIDPDELSYPEQALINRKDSIRVAVVAAVRSNNSITLDDLLAIFSWPDQGQLMAMIRDYVDIAVSMGFCLVAPQDTPADYWTTLRGIINAATDEDLAAMLGSDAI